MRYLSIILTFLTVLFATVINVPDDFSTIQAGIDASTSGDTVFVQPGTYYENINFNGKNISVIGENRETTVINGGQNGSTVTIVNGETSAAVLSGFRITNGASISGGGVILQYSSPLLKDLYITGNSAITDGGGIMCQHCINPQIINCIITGNDSGHSGGGLSIFNSSPQIIDCQVSSNSATDYGGGLRWFASTPTLIRVIINGNSTHYGGGIAAWDFSESTLTNVVIFNNSASVSGGGILVRNGSSPSLQNCVVWANTPQQVKFDPSFSWNNIVIGHTVFHNGVSGISQGNGSVFWHDGNLEVDPQFVNPYNGDFTLQATSPCIDSGNPDLNDNGINWEDDPADRDPDGTRLDIGAYYYEQTIGCMDSEAVNYNPDAIMDDGSCLYLDDIELHFSSIWSGVPNNPMGFYINSASIDEIDLRVGDEIAIFDGDICVGHAQLQSEIVPDLQVFASMDNPNTEGQDGFINGNEIHYRFWDASEQIELINIIADVTGGSEVFQSLGFSNANLAVTKILGCTDSDALNYDPEATADDGNCILSVYGCMDDSACNFNPEANTDDGSCLYYDCAAECGGFAYLDDCGVCDDDPVNDNECVGCTDQWALNYDPIYTIDDGSCEYPGFGDLVPDGSLNVLDVVALVEHVLEEFEYVSFADLNNDGYINIIDIVILVDVILNPELLGCTDPNALNFNPEAIYEDGSCEYLEGVTYDIDGNVYNTVIIGNQEWMAENLKVTHYNNGDPIPTGFTDSEWGDLDDTETGAYAEYPWDNDSASQETCNGDCSEVYGLLYNWYAVDDSRGVCPDGFHVPSDEEWMELEMALGMSYEEAHEFGWRGLDQGSQLAGNSELWWDGGALVNNPAFGSSGFLALPGGNRADGFGGYVNLLEAGGFWSATEHTSTDAWQRIVTNYDSGIYRSYYNYMVSGFSVRCLGDLSSKR